MSVLSLIRFQTHSCGAWPLLQLEFLPPCLMLDTGSNIPAESILPIKRRLLLISFQSCRRVSLPPFESTDILKSTFCFGCPLLWLFHFYRIMFFTYIFDREVSSMRVWVYPLLSIFIWNNKVTTWCFTSELFKEKFLPLCRTRDPSSGSVSHTKSCSKSLWCVLRTQDFGAFMEYGFLGHFSIIYTYQMK